MKNIPWPSREELSKLFFFPIDSASTVDENELCVFLSSNYNDERNARLFYEHPSNLTPPIPMSASNGDKEFYTPDKAFSILSASKNKDLAWKFIQFCIEEKSMEELNDRDNWLLGGYPIDIKFKV